MSIHSASAQDRFLRRTFCFSLVAALFLVTAHRLPAPIQEVPESPSPVPEQSAKPKKAQPRLKTKAVESELKTKPTPKPSATVARPQFAGTWRGTLPFGTFGDLHLTLVINKEGTLITESGGVVDGSHPGSHTGDVVTWHSGMLDSIKWMLTPNADGKTASLVVEGGVFIGNHSAVFQKISP
jgi:hypothetical protein